MPVQDMYHLDTHQEKIVLVNDLKDLLHSHCHKRMPPTTYFVVSSSLAMNLGLTSSTALQSRHKAGNICK